MLTKEEKIINSFLSLHLAVARSAWIKKVRGEKQGQSAIVSAMTESGFEVIDMPGTSQLSPDGREIIRVGGVALALTRDEHIRRRDAALAVVGATKKTKPVKPGEAVSSVLCPACQSVMAKSPVCPGCAKGRAGFKILCICTECSHEVYL